jgi:hypothetical protein
MDTLIVIAASTGLALTMLFVPEVAIATVTLGAVCLFIGTGAAILACVVGVPVAA